MKQALVVIAFVVFYKTSTFNSWLNGNNRSLSVQTFLLLSIPLSASSPSVELLNLIRNMRHIPLQVSPSVIQYGLLLLFLKKKSISELAVVCLVHETYEGKRETEAKRHLYLFFKSSMLEQ